MAGSRGRDVHVGAHVDPMHPLEAAAALGADCVQIFLSDPQGWNKPPPRKDAEELRRSDDLARLWEAIAGAKTDVSLGFCFDTCHAHSAGEELADAVERAHSICGRIDLLHANDSRDPPGTGADRHAPLGRGQIGAEPLRAMIRACRAPVVVETPGSLDDLRADIDFVHEALDQPARAVR